MDYSKIKVLQSQLKLSNDFMGEIIGKTGPGYNKMMTNKTCTVEYLEKFAEYFNKPISYFFDREEPLQVNEKPERYGTDCCKLCEEKDERIKLLTEMLEMYRGKKGNDVANSA